MQSTQQDGSDQNPNAGLFGGQQQQQQPGFSLGVSANANKNNKVKSAAEVAEQRKLEMMSGKQGEANKRGREDYAVKLRKEQREKELKAKRQNRDGGAAQIQQQPGLATDAQAEQQMEAAQSNGLQGVTTKITISMEEALTHVDQVSEDQFINEANNLVFKMEDFNKVTDLLVSDKKIIQIFAVIGLRRLLSFEQDPPIQQTVDRGLVPKLFEFAQRHDSPKLQFESIWCLTNVASSESRFVMNLVENKAIPILIGIMQTSQHIDVKEQAIWCIGNISGDNTRLRDTILEMNACEVISDLVDQAPAGSSFTRNASWTLANFCKGRPMANFDLLRRSISSLTKVMNENDSEEILTDITWAFSYASDEGGDNRIKLFLDCNAVPRLIQLLNHSNITIAVPCLRTLGNILTGSDDLAQRAIECGVLEEFSKLLDHPKRAVRKEVCWSISNVTAGNPNQIQKCIDIGLIEKLIQHLFQDTMDIKKEAVWAVSNATSQATPIQFQYFVNTGILQALGAVLEIQDPKTLTVSMEGIAYILKAGQGQLTEEGDNPYSLAAEQCGLMDKIESLQFNENQKVYEKAVSILEEFFCLEDTNDIVGMLQNQQDKSNDASEQFKQAFNF